MLDELFKGWPNCMDCGEEVGTEDVMIMIDVSKPVAWQIGHADCFDDEIPWYWIPGDRINTLAKAMNWTDHLSHKTWFAQTSASWHQIIGSVFRIPDA